MYIRAAHCKKVHDEYVRQFDAAQAASPSVWVAWHEIRQYPANHGIRTMCRIGQSTLYPLVSVAGLRLEPGFEANDSAVHLHRIIRILSIA